jgi:hypothetical protein
MLHHYYTTSLLTARALLPVEVLFTELWLPLVLVPPSLNTCAQHCDPENSEEDKYTPEKNSVSPS